MSDRPLDRYQQARQDRRRAFLNTRTLREMSPHVEQVIVELSFVDQSKMEHYSPQTHTFHPAATAFFEFPCPSSVCTGGGFDLGREVSSLIARGGAQTSGILDCMGQQSADRYDSHPALLQLHYRLTVSYRS
jgi:hypothetical protein